MGRTRRDSSAGVVSLIPELSVTDVQNSLGFYVRILGFSVAYARPDEGFACLTLGDAQLMIDQIGIGRDWQTATLEPPLGRGVNFQITVASVHPILENLTKHGIELFMPLEERWYRRENLELGNRQFLVQDPDGYLLRITEDLGQRRIQPTGER
ncbi:MAG: VOC family protein [Pleurocapsa sp. SU_196_0]|nr:VOC family protein [Pleurocapsa sp. SU_196_0]